MITYLLFTWDKFLDMKKKFLDVELLAPRIYYVSV